MKKSLERKLIKQLPLVKDIKLNVNEKDLYIIVLVEPGISEERKLWLIYDIRNLIHDNERYLCRLNVNYIMDVIIKENIKEFNEEAEYNNYNCDGGICYEI